MKDSNFQFQQQRYFEVKHKTKTKLDVKTIPNSRGNSSQPIKNHHILNTLKRFAPRSWRQESKLIHVPLEVMHQHSSNKLHSISRSSMRLVVIFALTVFIAPQLSYINCDTAYCPKDLTSLYPCSCANGTQGLLIKCSKTNLATISSSMRNIRDHVEQLEIEDSQVGRAYGPLFNDSDLFEFHSTVRELNIRSSSLRSIDQSSEGFSTKLKANLQYLMFDRNLLQQVPAELINNLTNLKLLNLSTNLITSIDSGCFTKLTSLVELDLSNNKISQIGKNSFSPLTFLEVLNLSGNEITKLDKNLLSFGKKLRYLDLSGNRLTSLDRQDFNELTNLETLRIANNQLTTLPRSIFSRNAKLYNLDLSFNKLEDVDTYLFKSVRFLKEINLSGNLIKDITKNTFSPTTRLKRVNLSQNSLSTLGPETFKDLQYLEKIDLSRNQIVNISNDAFNRIYSVDIDLSHNKLTRIFFYAFHEVSNITKLDLSHNLISDGISLIAFEQTDCAQLNLSYNQIQDISKVPVSNFTGIRILDISHNQITEFNKKSFTQKTPLYELHTIDSSFNNVSQISGNVLERLQGIRLWNISHNSLRRLTSGGFGQSPTLLELDLSYNNLVDVAVGTLVGLTSLKNLDLTYNRLKKMIPIPVALNSIHLEFNEISQLSKTAFPSLNSLTELFLDHNRIANIEDDVMSNLLALQTLSLSYNSMNSVPANALKALTSLQTLQLSGNGIQRLNRKAFGALPNVMTLQLDHNNISFVANNAFEGMLTLVSLNLSYNNINEILPESFAGLVSLRNLDVSNNQINRFENKTRSAMEDLLSLEVANFSSNKLSLISPRTFLSSPYIPQKLIHLDLSNNLVGILVNGFANGFKKLEWLSLRNNIINEIYPNVLGNASHLRYIDFSHNKLRHLKDGTFEGQFKNMSVILLSNNKLNSIPYRELDRLKSLIQLDVSSNRLETIPFEFSRWIRRGMVLDMRHNNLECTCDLLPFLAWIKSVQQLGNSTFLSSSNGASLLGLLRASNSNHISSRLLNQYMNSAQIVALTSCSKPEALSGKPLSQMLNMASLPEINCDPRTIEEADSLKRFRAPIQFSGSEPTYLNGEQVLRIGWNLVNQEVDLLNFVVIHAEYKRKFSLSTIRSSTAGAVDSIKLNRNENYQPIGQSYRIHRVSYDQRVITLPNLNPANYHVICVSYESSQIESSRLTSQLNGQNSSNLPPFEAILADYNNFNCADINTLLQQEATEKLISSSTKLTVSLALMLASQMVAILILSRWVVTPSILYHNALV